MAPPVYGLTVGGVAARLRFGFQIQEAANAQGKFTADIFSLDGSYQPALGDEIELTEDGVVIFGGVIDTPNAGGPGNLPIRATVTNVQASDYNSLPIRRVINLTLPAGSLKSWLQLIEPYLAIYGVTLDPAQADGPAMGDLLASFMRLDDALKQFSTLSNWVWEIDYTKTLRMVDPNARAAPFDVLPGNRAAFGDITIGPTTNDYGNRVLVLFGSGLHETTEAWTGDGTTASFPLTYTYASSRGYVTNNPPGHTGPDINETLGTAPALWSVDPSTNTLTRVAGAPVAGAAITFIYTAAYPSLVYSGNPPTDAHYWEKLYREPDIFDQSQAQQLSDGYLTQSLNQQRTIVYTTKQRGIHPGMVQHITVPERLIDGDFLVTAVQITNQTGKEATRQVTAIEGTDLGTDWRDMIRNWNTKATGASGSPAYIPPSGGGGGGGATVITGPNDYLVKITGPNQGADSFLSISGTTLLMHGGSLSGANVVSATTLQGAYDASQLTGTIPDARLSTNVALLNRPSQAFTGNVTIGGTLGVTGTSTLGALTAGSSTLGSLGVTGAATIGTTLGVGGNTTIGGTLGVTGVVSAIAFAPTPPSAGAPGQIFQGSGGLTLWTAGGSSWDFSILQPSGAQIARVPVGTNTIELAGGLNSIGYVSGTTGWRITAGGLADFRGMTVDEMNVKTFIVNQQRALTGAEIIARSAAEVAADFTVPAYGAAAPLTVSDLPGAPGMAAFATGDWVKVSSFSRSGGTLTVQNAFGTVSAPTLGLAGGVQSWTWTRGSPDNTMGGGAAPGTIVSTGSAAIDFGVSGSGFLQLEGADASAPYNANGPYVQINTWLNAPTNTPANMFTRVRLGNLYGITSVANEYGLIAGTYATSGGRFFRASSSTFELHGIDLLLWDGTVNTVKIDHTTPYFAMGNPRPTAYTDGVTGLWMGKDASVYKFRVGQPGGSGLAWDGSTLQVVGTITVTGGNAAKTDFTNVTAPWATSSATAGDRAALSVSANQPAQAWYGSGLLMGSNLMGYYNTSTGWRTYMDNAGHFYLIGTAAHSLSWDGTTLTIHGNITADSGTFTGTIYANAGTIGGWTLSGGNIVGNLGGGATGNVALNYSGLLNVGPSSNDQIVLSAFGISGGDSATRLYVGVLGGGSPVLRIRNDGSIYAQLVAAGSCSFSASRFVAPAGGASTGYSFTGDTSTYWGSDITGRLSASASNRNWFWDGTQLFPSISQGMNLGHPSYIWGTTYTVNLQYYGSLINASDARLKEAIRPTIYRGDFVRQLRPVDFAWTDHRVPGRHSGFLAQEVAAVAPDFGGIARDAGGVATGLNYPSFTPAIVAAVQELYDRLESLEQWNRKVERMLHGE